MQFRVIVAAEARRQIDDIVEDDSSPYPFETRRAYADKILDRIESLQRMPKRFALRSVNYDIRYRSFQHKAHIVIYRVDEPARTVTVLAVLHSRMDIPAYLRRTQFE